MTATLLWSLSGAAAAAVAPTALRQLIRRGVDAQLLLVLWAALVSGTSAAVALPALAELIHHCWLALPDGPARRWDMLAETLSGAAVVIAAVRGGWRVHRGNRLRRGAHERHLGLARILHGAVLPPGQVLWLAAEQPLAYCVAGNPALIVASTGLRDRLDPAALAAVVDHERAHLSGRHHLLVHGAEVAAVAFGWLPLMRQSPALVRTLVELDADAHAARVHGPSGLRRALQTMQPATTPAGALPIATDCAALRLARLRPHPPRRAPRRRGAARMVAVPAAILLAGVLIPALIGITALVSCAAL